MTNDQWFDFVSQRVFELYSEAINQGLTAPPSLLILVSDEADQPQLIDAINLQIFLRDEHGKDSLSSLMQQIISSKAADCIAMAAESWMSTAPMDEWLSAKPIPRPSQDPNRKEVLIINITTKTAKKLLTCPIHRNPDRLEWPEDKYSTGDTIGRLVTDPPDIQVKH